MNIFETRPIFELVGTILGVLSTIFVLSKQGRAWIKAKYKKRCEYVAARENVPVMLTQIITKVDSIDERVKKVEYEVSPNSSGSMKDKIAIIQAEMEVNSWLSPRPTFRTTSKGINLFVNEAYCQLCGCTPEELMKLGWKNFVCSEEQADGFYDRWIIASQTLSQFASKLKLQAKNGEDRGEWLIRIRPLGPTTSTEEEDYIWQGNLYPSDEIARNYAKSFGIPLVG